MSRLPEIENPHRRAYASDLSDAEWNVIEPLLTKDKGFGLPRTVDLGEILNAIFFVQRTGCQWEMLPHDLLAHEAATTTFRSGNAKASGVCSMTLCAIN
ncbi:conserved hypothetical protein (plasmid) [Acaryochloris marina MBIC11017]|uniref:Insertion element IS402-like domain-containing protein n=1 Tax=Acaryochloris marina (strain MBIC 11017) TaxID=329726 RepID=A8ZMS8_ACAM1|nr:conserved hypothetical protein [Acaryochloris marina MBIC11017]ABW32489.1 conserved hypothetical protein [Acaryochloris marina MBIC11017]